MEIKISFNEKNFKKISSIFESLKNQRHLKIILLIKDIKMSCREVHDMMEKERMYRHIENTYQALEKLTNNKILLKEYDNKKKKIFYSCNPEFFDLQ